MSLFKKFSQAKGIQNAARGLARQNATPTMPAPQPVAPQRLGPPALPPGEQPGPRHRQQLRLPREERARRFAATHPGSFNLWEPAALLEERQVDSKRQERLLRKGEENRAVNETYRSNNYRFSTFDPVRGAPTQYYRDNGPGGLSGRLRPIHKHGPKVEAPSKSEFRREAFFSSKAEVKKFHREMKRAWETQDSSALDDGFINFYENRAKESGGVFDPKVGYYHHEATFHPLTGKFRTLHPSGGAVVRVAAEGGKEPLAARDLVRNIRANTVAQTFPELDDEIWNARVQRTRGLIASSAAERRRVMGFEE